MSYKNKIKFSEDFTDMPIGRYRSEGSHSGEVFREDHLIPALELYGDDVVTVDLSDIYGMGGSFMDEAFGGLIRENGYTVNDLLDRLDIVGDDFMKEEINSVIKSYLDWLDGRFMVPLGRELSVKDYPDLSKVLGYEMEYSGDDFELPDTRGCFLRTKNE